MESPSEEEAPKDTAVASASSPNTHTSDPSLATPIAAVEAAKSSEQVAQVSTDAVHISTATKPRSRGSLHDQLEHEMNKRRPDHFVIGVTCRSLGGVPAELRSRVWKELLGVAHSERLNLDQSILQVEEDLDNQRVIAADAARTRGNEARFKQPETVELVIKLLTYYCKCRSIQYKQGMNEVLAPFLLLTEQREGSEESVPLAEGAVFQCFYALIDKFLPHVFVDREFRSLQCSFQLYRLLMLYHDPELCHYLDQHDMTPELYVTPWFMTLFARLLPPDFVFYLWDFFLLEEDPYLLHFVAYALVAANRKRILEADVAMLPQVLSSLTFASRDELEQVCSDALAISEATPRSFKRDLYSVCYGGFTEAMAPFLEQLYSCSSLQVYPEELVRNLLDRLASKAKEKHMPVLAPAAPVLQDAHQLTSCEDSLNPLLSPSSDNTPRLYPSGRDDEDDSTALKFIVLDCRPIEDFHKCHLSLSHHIDPSIMKRPDALDVLMKGFGHMKGCHFCFVGPSVDPSALKRSSSNSNVLNPIVRLARVISSDRSPQVSVKKSIEISVAVDVAGEVPPSSSSSAGPATLSRKQSPGEPGALASEIGSSGTSKVHAEHMSVTRLILMFLQKGFKYVSRLDGGFDELERTIRGMDTFSQEQLLVSSPLPDSPIDEALATPEPTGGSSSGGFNLLSKMGLNRSRGPSQDDFVVESSDTSRTEQPDATSVPNSGSISAALFSLSASSSGNSRELMKKAKKSSPGSAVSTLSQRLMLLKAAAKDAVSLSASSSRQPLSSDVYAEDDVTGVKRTADEEEWVEVSKSDLLDKSSSQIKEVELQAGPIGIMFQKSRRSKKFQAVVDSVVPDSQAAASELIETGDLLVAINGESLEDVSFLSVIELVIEASRPVTLRFLTPHSLNARKNKDALDDALSIPPLPPTLVSATRHSICITWDKLSLPSVLSVVPHYQLQFAKQVGDEFNPWVPVSMKQEGTTEEMDTTGVLGQTNGTMVGLDPGESLVFRVRCGDGQRWGSYSLSSGSMRTLDDRTAAPTSGIVTPTAVSQEGIKTAIFLPGVCPEYVEHGCFFYRVLLALRARRRPDFNGEKLDIILERGVIIKCSERLVCPGTNQVFVRLALGPDDDCAEQDRGYEGSDGELMLLRNGQREADDDAVGVWAFENTPDGDVVLERLPESAVEEIGPSLQEQAKSMVQSFLSGRGIIAPASDNGISNSAVVSSTTSSSGGINSSSSARAPAPRILTVFPASSTSIIVTWDPVNDVGVTKYQIQYVKDRLAAMWWTVKPDIDANTLKFTVTGLLPSTTYLFRIRSFVEGIGWGPYSDSSERCRTIINGNTSSNNSSSDDDSEQARTSSGKRRSSPTSSRQSASVRTGSTILDKAVAVATRLRRRSNSSNSPQVVDGTRDGIKDDDENGEEQQDNEETGRKSQVEPPSANIINLATWKSSSNDAHKDFRFYNVVKFEEQDADTQLTRLGERELVVTPAVLLVLNALAADREGFALVEEWRPLTSLTEVSERNDLDNSLVFNFKKYAGDSGNEALESERLIVVVNEAKACAQVVQEYANATKTSHDE
ncbi:hypothetical protein PHYBOEH_002684 [Phytophthora boehmeriae]|uniref:TBC1 domain family member 23 n=1 Tax=Phytophthora boehmeriae TaxID=109152 RepID=A0A8T1X5V1_9STRA|nr:hypothetical protein PHYBOEH_002684 [Phytophthora boehmeriae]